MVDGDQDQEPVEFDTEQTDQSVDLFSSMEEDMVFGGWGHTDLHLTSLNNDDQDRW